MTKLESDSSINPEFAKKYIERAMEGIDCTETENEFLSIKARLNVLATKQIRLEEQAKRKFVEIAIEDIVENAKRTVVDFDRWFRDGMYECRVDKHIDVEGMWEDFVEPDNWGKKLAKDAKEKAKVLYDMLIEIDSEDTVIYVSDRFQSYDNSKDFFSLDMLREEAEGDLWDDPQQFYDTDNFVILNELSFFGEKIKDLSYSEINDKLSKEGLFKREKKQ